MARIGSLPSCWSTGPRSRGSSLRSRFRAGALCIELARFRARRRHPADATASTGSDFDTVGKASSTLSVQTSTGPRRGGVGEDDGGDSAPRFSGGPVPDRGGRGRTLRAPARLDDRAQGGDERDGVARAFLGDHPRPRDAPAHRGGDGSAARRPVHGQGGAGCLPLQAVRRGRGSHLPVRQDRRRLVRGRACRNRSLPPSRPPSARDPGT